MCYDLIIVTCSHSYNKRNEKETNSINTLTVDLHTSSIISDCHFPFQWASAKQLWLQNNTGTFTTLVGYSLDKYEKFLNSFAIQSVGVAEQNEGCTTKLEQANEAAMEHQREML